MVAADGCDGPLAWSHDLEQRASWLDCVGARLDPESWALTRVWRRSSVGPKSSAGAVAIDVLVLGASSPDSSGLPGSDDQGTLWLWASHGWT
ncbi:hypothetical protein HPB47_000674 [Ixodes persulcatus]|uniref:Uncharacterized protein n=1 Tax=Ixodes persulcatus TaxID=34615 RepID=A0AC60PRU8_IXOPE|nr:hypothetical protein HPB47_000674 [Ixodes persulcatus]